MDGSTDKQHDTTFQKLSETQKYVVISNPRGVSSENFLGGEKDNGIILLSSLSSSRQSKFITFWDNVLAILLFLHLLKIIRQFKSYCFCKSNKMRE